jgi:ketosteroid isomerase-like protein
VDVASDVELAATAAAWDEAMVSNDAEAIGRFMADEWVIVGTDGGTTDKRTFLEQVRTGRLRHDTMTTADIRVRLYGDVAILLATGVSAGMFQGRRFHEHERQSNVFVRTNGAWRCVLTHLSRLGGGSASSDAA